MCLLEDKDQIINTSNLMTDLQINLELLEDSLLITKVVNLSGSFRSEKRLLRKYYLSSFNFLSLLPNTTELGFFAESYVVSIL